MSETLQIILGSTLATTLFTSIIAFLFHKKTERTNALLKREFELLAQRDNTDLEFKKQSAQLLGQVYMYLNRTRKSYKNKYSILKEYNQYYEDEIVYKSNQQLRTLLLENGHYIPPNLLEEASNIVEHFDVWFSKYHQIRKINKDTETIQIYVGPDGFHFPITAENKFKESYIKLYESLVST